jgi:ribonuclease BN (tRNA processing enzyme)
LDSVIQDYSRQAGCLICDSQFTPAEYESHRGWGHSTWLESAALARSACVDQLVLFHHNPDRDDQHVEQIGAAAHEHFANCVAAREGAIFRMMEKQVTAGAEPGAGRSL